jgi:hypothetical protein
MLEIKKIHRLFVLEIQIWYMRGLQKNFKVPKNFDTYSIQYQTSLTSKILISFDQMNLKLQFVSSKLWL